jgi:uncharacterized membrane protein
MLKLVEADSRLLREPVTVDRVRSSVLSARALVWLAAGTYAVVAASAATLDFVGFRTARFDLGNAVQPIWNTLHGNVLQLTDIQGNQAVRLGSHVDPLLLVFAPLWMVWSSPLMLLVVQAVAVSAGALPVFWLARKHLGDDRAAAFFALAYLAYPATQWKALDPNTGFHAVSLALPLLLYALWWLDEERWVLFGLMALLAAASKEQIPLIIGCLGLWYGASRRRPLVGLSIFAAGLGLTLFEVQFVVPHFSSAHADPFSGRYDAVGGTPVGILKTLAAHPLSLAAAVFTPHKLGYLGLMFVPLLGLCFRAPLLLAVATPSLAINLLSSSPEQTSISGHYGAATTAVLFGATILGAARIKADPLAPATAVFAAVTLTAVLSPLWIAVSVARGTIADSPRLRAQQHAIDLIPPDASVSATNILGAHLSARRRILMFPVVHGAQWIAVDLADTEGGPSFQPVLRSLRKGRAFTTVYEAQRVIVMRRRRVSPTGLAEHRAY